MKSKLLLFFLSLISILLIPLSVSADNSDEAAELIEEILKYKLETTGNGNIQEWIDSSVAENAGVSSEWYVIALRSYGDYDFSEYYTALEKYLAENDVKNSVTEKKYALTLAASGSSAEYISEAADNSENQGIMSLIFSLHLANNGFGNVSPQEYGDMILSMRKDDGGWAVMGSVSDTDVTAMAIQSLAPLYKTDEDIKAAADKAIDLLSSRQLDSGDFESMGKPNAESTAQVICALSSLGIDCQKDERFIKNGCTLIDGLKKYRLDGGGFSHLENEAYSETATVQALYSLISAEKLCSLYVFDSNTEADAETAVTAPSVQTETEQESTIQSKTEDSFNESPDIKIMIIIFIGAAAVILCIVMLISGKRHYKNFIAVTAISAVLIIIVSLSDIRSADDYYSGEKQSKTEPIGTVTITIRCDRASEKSDAEHIPENGIILDTVSYEIEQGDTVYTILTEAAQEYGIILESNGISYISGINRLYEFDFGELSGWIYHVNGESPSVGCGEYILSDKDKIEWLYTCELGNDL